MSEMDQIREILYPGIAVAMVLFMVVAVCKVLWGSDD